MKVIYYATIIGLFTGLTSFEASNCNQTMKNDCKKILSPFIHNGQFNTLALAPGESISAHMTFYSGHKYRILTCHQGQAQDVYFEVKTNEDQVVYSSKDKENKWDFALESSANLRVDVYRAKEASDDSPACVGLLIGFQE